MALGTSRPHQAPGQLPRGLVTVGLPLVSLALVTLFVLVLFPYDRFREAAVGQLAQVTGTSVSLEELEGGLSIGGPCLVATKLLLRWPDRRELLLERARIRPAWSFSWLRGEPALQLDVKGPAGSIGGTVWPVGGLAFAGRLRGIHLSELPLELLADPLPLDGLLDAEIELRSGRNGFAGEVRFESRDGSVAVPGLPLGIPYEEVRGELERSEAGAITVHEFQLSGPMISVSAEGKVEASRGQEQGPLDLEVDLVVVDPTLRVMVRPYGIELDPDGAASFRLSGTLSRPIVR